MHLTMQDIIESDELPMWRLFAATLQAVALLVAFKLAPERAD
ncbi:MAG: hypothetical protein QMB52_03130 [Propionivibrio sp.]